jgi:hypothetical protein
VSNPTVLETLQTYSAAENPVNDRIPQDFQMISTPGIFQEREQESCRRKQIPHDKTVRNDKALKGILKSGAHARNSMAFRRG